MESPSTSTGSNCGVSGFNGATAFEPWNQTRSIQQALEADSFNGATAFEPWNQPRIKRLTTIRPSASMGPRHLSRGIVRKEVESIGTMLLQWGHGI